MNGHCAFYFHPMTGPAMMRGIVVGKASSYHVFLLYVLHFITCLEINMIIVSNISRQICILSFYVVLQHFINILLTSRNTHFICYCRVFWFNFIHEFTI